MVIKKATKRPVRPASEVVNKKLKEVTIMKSNAFDLVIYLGFIVAYPAILAFSMVV